MDHPDMLKSLKLRMRNVSIGQLQQLFTTKCKVTFTAADKANLGSHPSSTSTASTSTAAPIPRGNRKTGSAHKRKRNGGKAGNRTVLNKQRKKQQKCSFCRKICKYPSHLKQHMVTHTKERPYSCSICQRSFARSSNLSRHIIYTHSTAVKRFGCDLCVKRFHTKGDLKNHTKRHRGEKSYRCNVCRCSFVTGSELRSHRRIHSLKKPFRCLLCEKRFKRKGDLDSHVRLHTGERPYKCVECRKCFVTAQALHMHRKSKGHLKNEAMPSADE